MILNFCRHLFAPDKFFHVFIPFLKKRTEHSFFEPGKNIKGTFRFVQDCNRLLARHWKLAVQKACFSKTYKRLGEFSLCFFQKWASIGRLDTLLAKTLDCNPHSIVPFLYEARRTVLTYPFLFENEDFFSGSAYRSHVSGENGHRKRIFSKTLAGVGFF